MDSVAPLLLTVDGSDTENPADARQFLDSDCAQRFAQQQAAVVAATKGYSGDLKCYVAQPYAAETKEVYKKLLIHTGD